MKKLVLKNQIFLVKFYSPKSKSSLELKEEWIKTAAGLQSLARVGAIDCVESPENKALCKQYGVTKQVVWSGKKRCEQKTRQKQKKKI